MTGPLGLLNFESSPLTSNYSTYSVPVIKHLPGACVGVTSSQSDYSKRLNRTNMEGLLGEDGSTRALTAQCYGGIL